MEIASKSEAQDATYGKICMPTDPHFNGPIVKYESGPFLCVCGPYHGALYNRHDKTIKFAMLDSTTLRDLYTDRSPNKHVTIIEAEYELLYVNISMATAFFEAVVFGWKCLDPKEISRIALLTVIAAGLTTQPNTTQVERYRL